ncbi:hypothetical protein M0R45_011439 [Rubus argutus]|uniref:Uncharacterized protein n=1 Tax=Rubus argutus TaxID=59490 RepID=A0AAW1YA09_RUBAR
MADNRDWPIYLQVITSGKNPFLMCVIEEKEKNGVLEESSSSSKWGKQKISVVLESRRDRIKQLPAPPPLPEDADFRYHVTSLVALNSKLYLMGEGFGLMVMDLAEEDENQWRRVSLLRGGKRPGLVEAVVGEDGFLYALKSDHTLHRIHHDHPRRQDKLIMDNSFKRLFGVSKKNIYIAMSEGMFCYDLKSRSLEIVGKNLGISLTALIPYDESINGSLQQYVEGLPTDGKTLPGPAISYNYPIDNAYLLQIGTHQVQGSPKLALVWRYEASEASDFNECQLHCCKFILHIRQDHDTSHPNFMAEILSTGIYRLGEDTSSVIDCTAGVMQFPYIPNP